MILDFGWINSCGILFVVRYSISFSCNSLFLSLCACHFSFSSEMIYSLSYKISKESYLQIRNLCWSIHIFYARGAFLKLWCEYYIWIFMRWHERFDPRSIRWSNCILIIYRDLNQWLYVESCVGIVEVFDIPILLFSHEICQVSIPRSAIFVFS